MSEYSIELKPASPFVNIFIKLRFIFGSDSAQAGNIMAYCRRCVWLIRFKVIKSQTNESTSLHADQIKLKNKNRKLWVCCTVHFLLHFVRSLFAMCSSTRVCVCSLGIHIRLRSTLPFSFHKSELRNNCVSFWIHLHDVSVSTHTQAKHNVSSLYLLRMRQQQ